MAFDVLGLAPLVLSHLASYLALAKFEVARHYHLNTSEMLAFAAIATRGKLSFKEMRQMLAMPKSTLTVVVDSLEKKHVVERERDRRDRRRWSVHLTPEGSRIAQEISELEAEALVRTLRKVPLSENATMRKALEELSTMAPPSWDG